MNTGLSRRSLLAVLPFSLAAQIAQPPLRKARPKSLPTVGEFTRLIDPVTENYVVRLTNPAHASILPASGSHFVSTRERTLLFSSDRTGKFQPFQVDLRTGVLHQLAETATLNPRSLCFDPEEKGVYFLDGDLVRHVTITSRKGTVLADRVSAFQVAPDGGLFLIRDGKLSRRAGKGIGIGEDTTVASEASGCWPNPLNTGCLFTRSLAGGEQELWYVAGEGGSQPVRLARGRINDPFWEPEGRSIVFLRDVPAPSGVLLAEIHQAALDGSPAHCLSSTSQFASFAPNGDAPVFVGASRSKAQPNIILMLRSPRREMTLCEHRSSQPAEVTPAFSPDSRRIYFESDRQGKSAIYSVNVESLVEPLS